MVVSCWGRFSRHKRFNQCCVNVGPPVYDGGSVLSQHWFNVLCMLESCTEQTSAASVYYRVTDCANRPTLNKCCMFDGGHRLLASPDNPPPPPYSVYGSMVNGTLAKSSQNRQRRLAYFSHVPPQLVVVVKAKVTTTVHANKHKTLWRQLGLIKIDMNKTQFVSTNRQKDKINKTAKRDKLYYKQIMQKSPSCYVHNSRLKFYGKLSVRKRKRWTFICIQLPLKG